MLETTSSVQILEEGIIDPSYLTQSVFITVEGIDGTGKTELVESIVQSLESKQIQVLRTRDPPGYPPWARIKNDILDRENDLDALSEAYIFLAARIDNSRRFIQPALSQGLTVVADRFVDSWLAYQAPRLANLLGGRERALDFLLEIHKSLLALGVLPDPDLTILIDDEPQNGLQRVPRESRTKYERLADLHAVRDCYQQLAKRFPRRIQVVDAPRQGLDAAHKEAMRLVLEATPAH